VIFFTYKIQSLAFNIVPDNFNTSDRDKQKEMRKAMHIIKRFENIYFMLSIIVLFISAPHSKAQTDGTKTIRINCGGPRLEYHGVIFEADKWYTGTYKYVNPNILDIYQTTYDELYFTERASNNDLGMFYYNIPVANGEFTVCLHFAEIYWNCPGGQPGGTGSRVFNVDIEDNRVLDKYDIIADAGCRTAVVKYFDVIVLDDTLSIRFKPDVNRPKISAIEVIPSKSGETPLGVNSEKINNELPDKFGLLQNYPNPFNPTTNIRFAVRDAGFVKLIVYNSLGEEVEQLVNEYKNPGTYELNFDANSPKGSLTSGIYYYRLETGGIVETKRMALVK